MTETASFAGQTVEAARRALAARFRERGIDSAELDARLLAGAALGLDLTGLMTATTRIIMQHEAAHLENFTRRRLAGEPVARILGVKEFWGLPLQLSPATLVPRPDTETVVELAWRVIGTSPRRDLPLRIVDIGTGSGAILLALIVRTIRRFWRRNRHQRGRTQDSKQQCRQVGVRATGCVRGL